MLVHVTDNAASFSADNYGAVVGPLTNGVEVGVFDPDDTQVLSLTTDQPVTSNADWGHHAYDVKFLGFGSGDESIAVRWTFTKDDPFGKGILLKPGYKFGVLIQDNLSGLLEHSVAVRGSYVAPPEKRPLNSSVYR
jgi:hypothetical protein